MFSHQELGTQIFAAMTFGTMQCTTFSACCDVILNKRKSSPMTSERGVTDTPFLLLHLQTHEGEYKQRRKSNALMQLAEFVSAAFKFVFAESIRH
jgi:hypothetical protein